MANKIRVKSALPPNGDGGFPVAVFERHPAHEGGELFIGDDKVHEVAMTPGVNLALNEKRLVETDEEVGASSPASGAPDSGDEAGISAEAKALSAAHSRDELNDIAGEEGLDGAAFPNKDALAQAIIDARAS